MLIRVYVAYMAAAQQLFERYGTEADPWMTLVGYFNSMRELGGMRRLVEDDVRSRLQKTEERGLARRRAPVMEELTSRMSSTEIPCAPGQARADLRSRAWTASAAKRGATRSQGPAAGA